MIRDTRLAILDIAKKLFNERGYNNVSTRDIAEALHISKGNLTYYFKKKEEIIEAILAETPNTRKQEAPGNLAELNNFFKDIQKTIQENAFYFWHYTQLAQISPKIRELQHNAFDKNIEYMILAFQQLALSGIFRGESFAGEYDCTIDTLLITSVYWVPFCKLKGEKTSCSFSQQAWSILTPLLTETGKTELQKLILSSLVQEL